MTEFSGKVEARQSVLDEFYTEVFPEKREAPRQPAPRTSATSATDDEIVARAMSFANGGEFTRLWNGNRNGHGSQSEADLALCSMLYFASGGSRADVERLFGQSTFGARDKWQKRADYRQRTLDLACQGGYWTPSPANGRAAPPVADAPSPKHKKEKTPNDHASSLSYPASPAAPQSTESSPPSDHMRAAIADSRPKVLLPGDNRPLDMVADELGEHLAPTPFFVRSDEVVWLDGDQLRIVSPQEFRTLVAHFIIGLRKRKANEYTYTVFASMTRDEAAAILVSPQLKEKLRPVVRFNRCRLPVVRADGHVVLLPEGYDRAAQTLTVSNVTYAEDMTLDEAVDTIDDLYGEFVFHDGKRSKAVTVASLLGLYAAQLLPQNVLRPAFIIRKNAEGCGGTTLVRCAAVTVLGQAPVGTTPEDEAEMRKAITTTVREGSLSLFLDNIKDRRLSSAALEAFLSSPEWKDRLLGKNENFVGPNLATVFATMNGGTISSDMRRRSLFVELHLAEERAEDRLWIRPLSNPKLLELRPRILAACWALIKNWAAKGRPQPSRSHSAFPEWACVVGGAVEAAGFCCPLDPGEVGAAADEDTESMRLLVQAMVPGKSYTFGEIVKLCRDNECFVWLVGGEMDPGAKSKLGWVFNRFDQRRVGGQFFIVEGQAHARRFCIAGQNEKVGGVND
jgi:hypothetical protein